MVFSSSSSSTSMSMGVNKRRASSSSTSSSSSSSSSWIRGVNIGGWLLAERYITPYLFAINSCQLEGNWCFYPGQVGAPPVNSPYHDYCDLYHCTPHLIDTQQQGRQDYPTDEYTLLQSFPNKALAKEYMTFHWDNFVTKADVKTLHDAGVTHARVPVPHYMMNDILDDEPWVDGQWLYFVRFVGWARQYDIQVWIDVHTAPGSQNGFDNSGQLLYDAPVCTHWITSPTNVDRSIKAIEDIAQRVMDDNLRDVVTGFGILNEPTADCDTTLLKHFNNEALKTVRGIMGSDTAVYMADSFNATSWNDGWWTDEDEFSNTYLDSHYYHVFAQRERALSPRQHIALTCAKLARETASCCYHDPPHNSQPSRGISRIVGEWSASFDTLVVEKLNDVMTSIRNNHQALDMDRTLNVGRKEFLRNHVEAQMVAFESAETGVSSGWFYWTLKTEGGAFAEWDFLRGLSEEWIPKFPPPQSTSESVFGSCDQIAKRTKDDMSIVVEFPNPDERDTWIGPPIDDDYVLSHAGSVMGSDDDKSAHPVATSSSSQNKEETARTSSSKSWRWFRSIALIFVAYGIWHVFLKDEYGFGRQRTQYTRLHSTSLSI